MFNSLEPSTGTGYRRSATFVVGMFIQVFMVVAIVFAGMLFPGELPLTSRHFELTWLPPLTPPEKPVVKMPRELPPAPLPKFNPPPAPKLTASAVPDLEVPKIRHIVPPPVIEHASPAPTPAPAPAPQVKEQLAVRTGTFGGATEPVTTRHSVEVVQTGGFGNPQGLPSRAHGDNPGNTPILGAFGLPSGPGNGNGSAGSHGIRGVVVSVGFGSGIAGVANGRGDGNERVVASAGFGSATSGMGNGRGEGGSVNLGGFAKALPVAATPVKSAEAPQAAEFQPIEIISKPAPVYTEEARQLGIQGDVALSVVFLADGSIRVTGIVKSLGHGLDREAEQVASQIRFKPAQRAGQPMDFPATLRIEFRLAGQSS